MYRIFCESYQNYIKQNNSDDYRSQIAKPLGLIADVDLYNSEKIKETELYKQLCDLLYYMEHSTDQFPRFKAFLWTIEAREMIGKHYYGITSETDMLEQAKLVNSILKLVYWDAAQYTV